MNKYKDRKLEKAVKLLGLWAIRYCLSRDSYAFYDLEPICRNYWEFFTNIERETIIREFNEALASRQLSDASRDFLASLIDDVTKRELNASNTTAQ